MIIIESQNKHFIGEVHSLRLSAKSPIILGNNDEIILGEYATDEQALQVLKEIKKVINDSNVLFYDWSYNKASNFTGEIFTHSKYVFEMPSYEFIKSQNEKSENK